METAATTSQSVSQYERERGKPMPSKNHSIVQAALIVALHRYSDRYTVLPELSLDLNGRQFVPDVAIYPRLPVDWLHDEIRVTEPPLLVVEILSPQQATHDLVEKFEAYLAAGVGACWLVQPVLRTLVVFLPGTPPQVYTQGAVADAGTEIEVRVEELFGTGA